MLDKYKHIWDGSLGEITASEYQIGLVSGTRIIRQHSNLFGTTEREFLSKQVDQLLEQKFIRSSNSSWDSPIVLAPKKDGKLRM